MSKKPFKCPVCRGSGQVPSSLYQGSNSATNLSQVQCRACDGEGIVWGPPHDLSIEFEWEPPSTDYGFISTGPAKIGPSETKD